MQKNALLLSLTNLLLFTPIVIQAHSHHHTYIVEQPAPTVIVERPAPTVVVVQQPPQESVNIITVESQPPADLYEVITQSPGDDYTWQKGHWQWNGNWVWVKGGWIRRPNPGGVYVPGYWRQSHHHHRWEWVEPHWK